jgi:peptidyl-prolyl cis-trans isomerase SurA
MRTIGTLLLAGAILSAASGCLRAEVIDGIEAIVSQAVITSQQIDTSISLAEMTIRDQYGPRSEQFRQEMVKLHTNSLEMLITRQLILHEFDTLEHKIPESAIDRLVDEEIRSRNPDRVQFIKDLSERGMSLEKFRKQFRDNLIIDALVHQNVPEPIISPHRIEAYYKDHRADYKIEEQVKTRMIVLNQSAADEPGTARKRAEEILAEIKGGATFDEMAKIYSDSSPRARSATSEWLELGKLAEAIREPVSHLKTNECSGVIEAKSACFLVLLEDKRPAHYTPLNEVRVEIETSLKAQEKGRLERRWIDRLRRKTFVRYFL